jgi:hypothetical protein
MVCLFNHRLVILAVVGSVILSLSGCLSYQYERRVEGIEISDSAADAYPLGKTTLSEVLLSLGAPDEVYSLNNSDLLVYQRSLIQESGLSLGVPILNVTMGGSIDISATGALTRYDTLIFWFNPQGMLEDIVFEKASSRPYLKTLFSK